MQFLLLAMLPLAVSADACTLQAGFAKLEMSCSIPASTQISSECCGSVQSMIDESLAHQQNWQPSQAEQQTLQQNCMNFMMYVMTHAPQGPPPNDPVEQAKVFINALPDGLQCTEKIKGAGRPACALHAKFEKLEETCEIPEETTITSECCDAVQGGIDTGLKYLPGQAPPAEQNAVATKVMSACQSVAAYAQEHQPVVPAGASPQEQARLVINSVAPGTSCTQAISGGDMLSLFAKNAIISNIALAAGVGGNVSREASSMPLLAAGIAGFLAGGLIVAGVLSRSSKRGHASQYSLLAEEAA